MRHSEAMEEIDTAAMIAANAANWDARTSIHLASDFYDLSGRRPDLDWLPPFERSALGDLTGLDAVHLQCHFGLETLELARLGARAIGLDLSAASKCPETSQHVR